MVHLFIDVFRQTPVKKVDKPGFFYIVAIFLSIVEVCGSLVGPSDFKSTRSLLSKSPQNPVVPILSAFLRSYSIVVPLP
jgi:hypothetical protein